MGRLTRDPEVRYSQGENGTAVARYTIAVDRRMSRDNEADFIPCVCFGKTAEFVEKYLHKGTKIAIVGRLQTGSYTNKEGTRIFTTDVVVEEHEFAESKNTAVNNSSNSNAAASDGFMNIPEGIDEKLPFN